MIKTQASLLTHQLPLTELPAKPAALTVVRAEPTSKQPHTTTRSPQAWLALRLPEWPLYAAQSGMTPEQRTALADRPIALMQEDRQRSVLCCTPLALQRGIRPGHSLNAAIALCADLQFLARDERAEQRLLEELALDCQTYTPCVVIQAPNELLLEIRGSLRLFGGVKQLLQLLSARLTSRGIMAAMAVSGTAQSAQWLCRATQTTRIVPGKALPGVVSQLPLQALHWPADVILRLNRFGIAQVGDLLRLPRGGLARRIGKSLLAELDQALGRRPDLRRSVQAPLRYRDRILLDFEIETTALAQRVLDLRLRQLQQFLIERTLAISELGIALKHRDHAATPIRIGLAAPTANMAHVGKLLQEALSKTQLPAPIREIRVSVDHLVAPECRSGDLALDPSATNRDRNDTGARARLLEQFHARLGPDRIKALGVTADHRPERTQLEHPADLLSDRVDREVPAQLPLRPLWLLPQPRLLPTMDSEARNAALVRGPERIHSGWWDGAEVERDYFVAKSRHGSLWWVFQDRRQPTRWYLHGLFA
ncbi:MAG TPA: DNA polymerase Y family protein [Steroidobacteraceae bacterium]|jgi:protein ImuB